MIGRVPPHPTRSALSLARGSHRISAGFQFDADAVSVGLIGCAYASVLLFPPWGSLGHRRRLRPATRERDTRYGRKRERDDRAGRGSQRMPKFCPDRGRDKCCPNPVPLRAQGSRSKPWLREDLQGFESDMNLCARRAARARRLTAGGHPSSSEGG